MVEKGGNIVSDLALLPVNKALNTVAMADDYFEYNYMSGDIWEAIPTTTKACLIITAERDILSYLRTFTVDEGIINEAQPYTSFQMAVFEWAVYLHSNKDLVSKNIADKSLNISTVSIDGIGRETRGNTSSKYMDTYNDMIARSPAARYLAMIYKDYRIIQ